MPTAAHIEMEHWEGPHMNCERIECSSVQTLRECLSRLDGDKIDSVTIDFSRSAV